MGLPNNNDLADFVQSAQGNQQLTFKLKPHDPFPLAWLLKPDDVEYITELWGYELAEPCRIKLNQLMTTHFHKNKYKHFHKTNTNTLSPNKNLKLIVG